MRKRNWVGERDGAAGEKWFKNLIILTSTAENRKVEMRLSNPINLKIRRETDGSAGAERGGFMQGAGDRNRILKRLIAASDGKVFNASA